LHTLRPSRAAKHEDSAKRWESEEEEAAVEIEEAEEEDNGGNLAGPPEEIEEAEEEDDDDGSNHAGQWQDRRGAHTAGFCWKPSTVKVLIAWLYKGVDLGHFSMPKKESFETYAQASHHQEPCNNMHWHDVQVAVLHKQHHKGPPCQRGCSCSAAAQLAACTWHWQCV
jgi:hypothetical protein